MKRRKRIVVGIVLVMLCFGGGLTGCNRKDPGAKMNEAGMEAFEKKEFEEAGQKFSQAVVESPENAEYCLNYGFALIGQKKIKEAVVQMKKVIELSEGEKKDDLVRKKQAYRGIGIAYFEGGSYRKAAGNFTKALGIEEADSMNVDILSYRADTYIGQGNYEKAVADLGKVLEENEKDADIYAKRAELFGKIGDTGRALVDYDKAIELDEKNVDFYVGKYYLLERNGRTKEKAETMDLALTNCSEGKKGAYQSGYLLFVKKEYAAAEEKLQEALKDGNGEANYYLGEIYRLNGDLDTANSYYRQCVTEENGKAAKAYNQLASIAILLGNYEEASGFIKLGLGYHDLTVRRELKLNEIIICEQKRYWVKARNKAEELLKLYPGDEEISKELDFLNTRARSK